MWITPLSNRGRWNASHLVRLAIWRAHAQEESRLYGRSRFYARTGYRREYRHLQCRKRSPAAPASLSGIRANYANRFTSNERLYPGCKGLSIRVLAGPRRSGFLWRCRISGLEHSRSEAAGRGSLAEGPSRERGVLPRTGGYSCPGPRIYPRGNSARFRSLLNFE